MSCVSGPDACRISHINKQIRIYSMYFLCGAEPSGRCVLWYQVVAPLLWLPCCGIGIQTEGRRDWGPASHGRIQLVRGSCGPCARTPPSQLPSWTSTTNTTPRCRPKLREKTHDMSLALVRCLVLRLVLRVPPCFSLTCISCWPFVFIFFSLFLLGGIPRQVFVSL